jgi:hypothetical protein
MKYLLLLLLLVLNSVAAPKTTPPGADFTVAVLPDTQFYCRDFPKIFEAQTEWIIANRTNLNIVYVGGLGDIVQDGDKFPEQWHVATNALYRLENPARTGLPEGIPYGTVPGNHDHIGGIKSYNQYFGVDRFAGRKYYGGHYGDNNQSHFDLLSASGLDFIFLYVDYSRYGKKAEKAVDYSGIDAWADSVLKSHANRRAVVLSHDILAVTGEFDPRGREIHENLKDNPNLFLLLSGHNSGEARRTDVFAGQTIHACLSDYQSWTNGGNGFLRTYQFSPSNNVIRVKTYSPWIDQFLTNASSQFEIPYVMTGSSNG